MTTTRRTIALAIALSASPACYSSDLPQRFKDVCNAPDPVSEATVKAIDSTLFKTDINELSSVEMADILSSVDRCLASRQTGLQHIGLLFLLAAEFRPTPINLPPLDIERLKQITLDSSSPLQNEALYFLIKGPNISKEVMDFLQDQLKGTDLSPKIAAPIVAALVGAGGDREKAALSFADAQKDASVQIAAVQRMGHLQRALSPVDISFIQTHLDSENQFVRYFSLETVDHFSRSVREPFTEQITKLAIDPNQTKELRDLANEVLAQ